MSEECRELIESLTEEEKDEALNNGLESMINVLYCVESLCGLVRGLKARAKLSKLELRDIDVVLGAAEELLKGAAGDVTH